MLELHQGKFWAGIANVRQRRSLQVRGRLPLGAHVIGPGLVMGSISQ
jgi:hypothetical protein